MSEVEELIKKTIITSIYSNDFLIDYLVLKGGNAIAYVHQISLRKSVDVDFSLSADFNDSEEVLEQEIKKALNTGFNQIGYRFFDFKFIAKPEKKFDAKLGEFWGGYSVTFKILTEESYQKIISSDLDESKKFGKMQSSAVAIAGSPKIEIDISRVELTQKKIEVEMDGLTIFAYSTEMIIAEKLRAICQQMREYGPIIHRHRPGSSRAKDFFDIYILCNYFNIDMGLPENIELIKGMFEIKKVPLEFLEKINEYKDFHESSFSTVQSTIQLTDKIQSFDFYFNFVTNLYLQKIKPNL